jgi:serine/threonine protein kinase/tetratricopeptide (TPR) repeat protein
MSSSMQLDFSNEPSCRDADLPNKIAESFSLHLPHSVVEFPDPPSSPHSEGGHQDGSLGSLLGHDLGLSRTGSSEVSTAVTAKLPSTGDEVLGLRLVRELGRGAFARVFLANEIGLAERLVAAKISFTKRDESHTLAQLQHSHIVPIYSAQVDRATGLRVLVMPYFGGATLDRLLAKACRQAEQNPTGRSLLTALDHLSIAVSRTGHPRDNRSSGPELSRATQATNALVFVGGDRDNASLRRSVFGRAILSFYRQGTASTGNASQPARYILEKSSYVQAMTWIAARLAEGLSHAHQRGIVHRDIKPSNVLIAADGQPMLLDFNLARDLKSQDASAVAYVGGTLPYMAPEHLDAFNTQNPMPATAVDERSDIYSLGVVLFEMLTNERPFNIEKPEGPLPLILDRMATQRRGSVPSASALNSAVPWSLDAIVRRCLEPDPTARYQDAASLAEDLQCELESLPLRHTREPSWRERVQKWMRRHPRISSGASIASISTLLIAALVYLVLAIGGRLAAYDAERRWIKFQEGLVRAQLLVHTANEPGENVLEGERICTQTLSLFDILSDRDWLESSRVRHLGPKVRRRLPEDATELIILLARTRAEQAKRAGPAREQTRLLQEAVALLDRAEEFPSQTVPRALFEDRSDYRLQLGDSAGSDWDLARAESTQVQTARDHYLRGTALATEKNYDMAIRELRAAQRLDPRHFWASFQIGICCYQLGQFAAAADAYNVCEAIWIECAWANFNRGLAYSRLDRLNEAIADYTAAIRKDPAFAEAYLNRGLAYVKRRKYDEAIADLTRAVELGSRSSTAAWSGRATALAGRGQFNEARAAYEAALHTSPGDASILLSRGFALARHDSQQALADFDRVLAANAECAQALYGRAYVLSETGDGRDDAVHAAREAIRIEANHIGARCTLAILLARGENYEEAIAQIETALQQSAAAVVQYSAACVYALASRADAGHAERALELLESALNQHYGREIYATDADLAPLHQMAEFRELSERLSTSNGQ